MDKNDFKTYFKKNFLNCLDINLILVIPLIIGCVIGAVAIPIIAIKILLIFSAVIGIPVGDLIVNFVGIAENYDHEQERIEIEEQRRVEANELCECQKNIESYSEKLTNSNNIYNGKEEIVVGNQFYSSYEEYYDLRKKIEKDLIDSGLIDRDLIYDYDKPKVLKKTK